MEHDEIVSQYRKEFEKPLAGIREDPFFREDNFQEEPWYGEFLIYTRIGVCQPAPEHVQQVQKALKIMGFSTHAVERGGKMYVLPGEERGRQAAEKKPRAQERGDER